MKNFGAKWLAFAAVVGAAAGLTLNGCGGGGSGGTAGTTGTAGGGGRGGTTGTGGTTGSAGRGGTTGSAGATAGTTGSAGATAGTTGTAGTGGAAGGLPCPGVGTFDTSDMMGFALNTFMDTAATATVNIAVREAGARATISVDATDGDPAPGSIKVDAPFDAYKQFIDVQHNYGSSMLKNWAGGKLHVKLKVVGGNPSSMNPMGVQPYVNTGTGYNYCGKYFNLIAGGGWNEYVLDLTTCTSPADPSMVIAFGVSLQTGDGSNGDGGVNPSVPAQATVHVDSFYVDFAGGSCTPGTGGTTGTAGAGGTTGTAGASGTTGTAGASGTTGTAGAAGGTAGAAGGTAGASGAGGGTGGAATTALYDFESGVQSWTTSTPTTVAQSTDQHLDGTQSLKVTYGVIDNTNVSTSVSGPALWPGTVVTFHAYLPAGFDTSGTHYFQAFGQGNNYGTFDTTGNSARTATAGAWNTWTYTVPNMFPGGLQLLGFQLGDNSAGTTIPAGSVYLDNITVSGGTQNCALATPTGSHTFEMADAGTLDTNVYKKDGSDADTVISQSTDQASGGTHSWKVALTALPAPTTAGTSTSRRVFIDKPNIYCGQMATFHVYLPAASDGLGFQAFVQYNNYGKNSFVGPSTVTRGAFNTYVFTVPADVGPGGIQQLGVQINWSGTTTFTGNVYIDDITW